MNCPVDGKSLQQLVLEDVTVDVCSECHGVWLDGGELRRLVHHFSYKDQEDTEMLLERWQAVHTSPQSHPKDFWIENTYQCPKDIVKMQKHYFAGTMVGIDHCRNCCGFWIDGKELRAIAAEVRYGPEEDMHGKWKFDESLGVFDRYKQNKTAQRAVDIGSALLTNKLYALSLIGYSVLQLLSDEIKATDFLPAAPPA